MPSPIAHVAAGAFISSRKKTKTLFHENRWIRLFQFLLILFFSMAPDLDSVVGFFSSDFGSYHNQFSHSLFTGLVVGLFAAAGAKVFRWKHPLMWFWIAFISCAAHVCMDYFTYGRGVKLFWPVTNQRFQPPFLIFYGLHWSEGAFSTKHIITAVSELATILLFYLPYRFVFNRSVPHNNITQNM